MVKFRSAIIYFLMGVFLTFSSVSFAADPVVEAAQRWNLKFSTLNNNNPPLNIKWEPIHQKAYLKDLLYRQSLRGGDQYLDPDKFPDTALVVVNPAVPLDVSPPKVLTNVQAELARIQEEMKLIRNKFDVLISDMQKL